MIAISFPFTDAGREFILILEPLLKTKKCVKESTLFNHIHKHNFGGLGTDTDFLQVDSFRNHFLDFLYTNLCNRGESTLLFFVVTIAIKSRLFLKNPRKPGPFS